MCVCVCVQSVSQRVNMSVQSTTSSKSVGVVVALCVILVLVTHSTTLASSAGTTLFTVISEHICFLLLVFLFLHFFVVGSVR